MVFLLGEESKKKKTIFLHIVWGQVVYLLLDVIQWIQYVFAQGGSSREEAV